MANNYRNILVQKTDQTNRLGLKLHYELKRQGKSSKHTISLMYNLKIKSETLNLGDFMELYIENVLKKTFTLLQTSETCWTKITIKNLLANRFEYQLGYLRGHQSEMHRRNEYYEFNIQSMNQKVVHLKVYGVPRSILDNSDLIHSVESRLLNPIDLGEALIELRGLRVYNSEELLSVTGTRFKRNSENKKSKKRKSPPRARKRRKSSK